MGKPGPKGKYDPKRHPRVILSLARKGRTNEEIAKKIGISRKTLGVWASDHAEIGDALREGREFAVATIEDSMYARATGASRTTEKKVIEFPDGLIKKEVVERELPPDPGAAKLLLMNWAPEEYKDRHELTGKDGGPIVLTWADLVRKAREK